MFTKVHTNKVGCMFSARLQEMRKKLQLTKEEISLQTGISQRAYTSYECGERKPSLDFFEKLVALYNVNLNCLIAGQGEMFNIAPQDEQLERLVAQIVDKKMKEKGL